jgi:hypothetical protein
MLWRSEIRINLKIDADAGVACMVTVKYSQDREGSLLVTALACGVFAV